MKLNALITFNRKKQTENCRIGSEIQYNILLGRPTAIAECKSTAKTNWTNELNMYRMKQLHSKPVGFASFLPYSTRMFCQCFFVVMTVSQCLIRYQCVVESNQGFWSVIFLFFIFVEILSQLSKFLNFSLFYLKVGSFTWCSMDPESID